MFLQGLLFLRVVSLSSWCILLFFRCNCLKMVLLKYLNQQQSCVRVFTSQFWFPNPCVIFWQEKKHYCCFCICTIIIISIGLIAIVCVCYVVYQFGKPLCHKSLEPMNTLIFWVQVSPAKSIEYFMCIWLCYHVIVGGHTAEMINVLTVLQKDMLLSRIYVASATDNLSLQKSSGFGGQYGWQDSRSTYT